jgi:hypothetical protein
MFVEVVDKVNLVQWRSVNHEDCSKYLDIDSIDNQSNKIINHRDYCGKKLIQDFARKIYSFMGF